MTEHMRVAAVQLDYMPVTRVLETGWWLDEPLLTADPWRTPPAERWLLFGLAARTPGLQAICAEQIRKAHESYCSNLRAKLDGILLFCRQHKVNLVVFPEYAVPAEMIGTLLPVSKELAIVAGVGYLQEPDIADLCAQHVDVSQVRVGNNAAVVLASGKPLLVTKKWRAAGEDMIPGTGPRHSDQRFEGRPYRLGVALCLDYLTGGEEYWSSSDVSIVAITALTRAVEPYAQTPRGYVRLFANHAAYGGTYVGMAGLTAGIFADRNGTKPLPKGNEGIVIVDWDFGRMLVKPTPLDTPDHRVYAQAELVYTGLCSTSAAALRQVCQTDPSEPLSREEAVRRCTEAAPDVTSLAEQLPILSEAVRRILDGRRRLPDDQVDALRRHCLLSESVLTVDEWRYGQSVDIAQKLSRYRGGADEETSQAVAAYASLACGLAGRVRPTLRRTGFTQTQDSPEREVRLEHVLLFRKECAKLVTDYLATLPADTPPYVARHNLELEFQRFLRSDAALLVLQGRAGTGKTYLAHHLAKEHSARIPVLFLQGSGYLAGAGALSAALAAAVSAIYDRQIEPTSVIRLLHALLAEQDGQMVVFVDSSDLGSQSDMEQVAIGLATALPELLHTGIKLCLTCRDIEWRRLCAYSPGRFSPYLYDPQGSLGESGRERGLLVQRFSPEEFRTAWETYSRHYGVTGELPPDLQDICREPRLLRLLCEYFRKQPAPRDSRYWGSTTMPWESYWETRVRQQSLEEDALRIACELYEGRATELRKNRTMETTQAEAQRHLLEEGVLASVVDPSSGTESVHFAYPGLHEYALSRHLMQGFPKERSGSEALSRLVLLLDLAADYPPLYEAIHYLLLSVDRSELVGAFLSAATERAEEAKVSACEFLSKVGTPRLGEAVVSCLLPLAHDESPQVRWTLANALGFATFSRGTVSSEHLMALATSHLWTECEVAAFALGYAQERYFPEAFDMLGHLVTHVHWRVRRAVGHSLYGLYVAHPSEADGVLPVLREWGGAPAWQRRQAVAKCLQGPFTDPQPALELLEALFRDPHEEVRWLVVLDLVSMATRSETSRRAGDTLLMMICDPSVLVRKHIATWAPDFLRALDGSFQPVLDALAVDMDRTVRWELARTLGSRVTSAATEKVLDRLKSDPDADVAYAAACSLSGMGPPPPVVDTHLWLRFLAEKVARSSDRLVAPEEGGALLQNTWRGDRYASVREALEEMANEEVQAPEERGQFLRRLLQDEDEGVRWGAVSSVLLPDLLSLDLSLPILLEATKDPHYWVRREAISALAQLLARDDQSVLAGEATQNALAQVEMLTLDGNPEVRYAALQCLMAHVGCRPVSSEVLRRLACDSDEWVRRLASDAADPGGGQ